MNIYEHIRESRIYSYIVTCFTLYHLSKVIEWVYSLNLDNLTSEQVGLVTVVLTALVGILKMTYTFATSGSQKEIIKNGN